MIISFIRHCGIKKQKLTYVCHLMLQKDTCMHYSIALGVAYVYLI